MAGQASPRLPKARSPAPMSAPVRAWVVETGSPVRDATSTQAIAPTRTAPASAGGAATPGWNRPELNVFSIAPATTPDAAAPRVGQIVPQMTAVRWLATPLPTGAAMRLAEGGGGVGVTERER